MNARNAREEAQQIVGDRFEARVLEPSPPAIVDGEWFADDPVAVDGDAPSRPVVSPVAGADLTWEAWLGTRPQHAEWAAARWLGAYRSLTAPSTSFAETKLAVHRLAVYVVSPARRRTNGKLALRWTIDGVGTPFFGADEQVRVAGRQLVRQAGASARAEPITSLARAAAMVLDAPPDISWAESFDVPGPGDLDAPLPIDEEDARLLGDWFGFAYSVLEALRADRASTDPSRVQLWAEHFDAAFDCLSGDRRATFGASPGDTAVPEPYLYVLPRQFEALPPSQLWNADSFRGAILPLHEFVEAPDQRAAALRFFRSRRDAMQG
jgi:hypothetical protein